MQRCIRLTVNQDASNVNTVYIVQLLSLDGGYLNTWKLHIDPQSNIHLKMVSLMVKRCVIVNDHSFV